MHTLSSASRTCIASASAVEWTATVAMPISYTELPNSTFLDYESYRSGSAPLSGGSVAHLQGAIYMPASDVSFTGNSAASNGCTQVIGRTVTFTGSSTLGSNCGPSSGTGTSTIATNETIAVTE